MRIVQDWVGLGCRVSIFNKKNEENVSVLVYVRGALLNIVFWLEFRWDGVLAGLLLTRANECLEVESTSS